MSARKFVCIKLGPVAHDGEVRTGWLASTIPPTITIDPAQAGAMPETDALAIKPMLAGLFPEMEFVSAKQI